MLTMQRMRWSTMTHYSGEIPVNVGLNDTILELAKPTARVGFTGRISLTRPSPMVSPQASDSSKLTN
jgi:hypothetical protein